MQSALVQYLACPSCHAPLTSHALRGDENDSSRIVEGLLVCRACSRWYPIVEHLPELLPDHLRDPVREADLFARLSPSLPPDILERCRRFEPGAANASDAGAHHKRAEIGITSKIHDEAFFGPGHTAPFNPENTAFTLYLLHLFGAVAPLLEVSSGDLVIDSGCGYSWTTEWLHRSGIRAIGVDICRAYLEIAMQRMGATRPHLVVADVEHLPIRSACADAVLAYESFHHIPDRRRAFKAYERVLKSGGRLVLAEPGAAHEHAAGSVEVMEKYGILEKGMELADVASYAEGTAFASPEEIFLLQARHADLGRKVVEIARRDSGAEGHLFRLRKGNGAIVSAPAASAMGSPRDEPTGAVGSAHFDAHYYATCCGKPYKRDEEWLRFFGTIAGRIVDDIAPATALDAGCAIGLLVETLRDRGIDAEGIDISNFAIAEAPAAIRPHLRVGSIAESLDRRYDLIVCIEVLEHMPPAEAERAVANFCAHTDDVLFSSSPSDYGEATHVNVRPPEAWGELFARHGFLRDVDYDASYITPWAVRYRRRREPLARVVRDYERAFARIATERNELRTQVLRFDREVLTLAAEAPRLRSQLASVNQQLHEAQVQLLQAKDRIHHMERSAFWRLRDLWLSLRALLRGRPPTET